MIRSTSVLILKTQSLNPCFMCMTEMATTETNFKTGQVIQCLLRAKCIMGIKEPPAPENDTMISYDADVATGRNRSK